MGGGQHQPATDPITRSVGRPGDLDRLFGLEPATDHGVSSLFRYRVPSGQDGATVLTDRLERDGHGMGGRRGGGVLAAQLYHPELDPAAALHGAFDFHLKLQGDFIDLEAQPLVGRRQDRLAERLA